MVDDLLRAALNLGVAALDGVKIQLCRIRARSHGAGSAAAHANAHAGAAQLDQQRACGEFDFVCQIRIDRADAASNHDRLVIAPMLARDGLLKAAKIARQIRAAKFVVERCAA